MENTASRLELIRILSDLVRETPKDVIDKVVYLTQGKLYPDFLGVEIGVADKLAMRAIAATSGRSLKEVEQAYHRLGDIGSAGEELLETKGQTILFSELLTVKRVYTVLDNIAKASGKGSLETRIRLLSSLLNDASKKEIRYILRTATGRLRLGIADYTVLDALAVAYTGDRKNRHILERAYNLSSDLGLVAKTVADKGLQGVERFHITVGRPVRPMLAERLGSASEILEKIGGEGSAEYKLDGERVQVHMGATTAAVLGPDGTELFSRRLERITSHYPDVVALCRTRLRCRECIIEGEIVAINIDTGDFLPFQELMHRRRKYGIKETVEQYPVSISFFDLLYVDGESLINKNYVERRERLLKLVDETERVKVVPALVTSKADDMEVFMDKAISEGCEGLVVKDLKSVYRAGAREFAWIKLKREYKSELSDTLDLVIVGSFYGRGRRSGRYGAFLLAAYDKDKDVFETTSKIGSGFSDEDLDKFVKMLEPLKLPHRHTRVVSKTSADVWFTPQIVIEVIASEITLSPIYTLALGGVRKGSGLALRFPKFTGRVRDDKSPTDSTTAKEILEMYRSQLKKISG
ncbi:MAG: ATP-dependent DNA ligase [Thaumarchaeota archaeon]|nr:ATP-dependent DNA ligase [Nitrososphaerota archaeon]MCL5317441.1 ATP-dependent DNA ligase [Nitrososphaerota archaeon]